MEKVKEYQIFGQEATLNLDRMKQVPSETLSLF